MKYELTDESIEVDGRCLYRIRYIDDDTLGGWLESKDNLLQNGNARVSGNAKVYGGACVSGDAHISGRACVFGNVRIFGNAQVSDNAEVSGIARIYGQTRIYDNARVSGNVRIHGHAEICRDAQLLGMVYLSGNACIFGGTWDVSPLQIQGSKYFFCVSSKDTITIGDTTKTIAEWRKTYETEFDKYKFTEAQCIEYKLYFNLAAQLYGWDVQLPV